MKTHTDTSNKYSEKFEFSPESLAKVNESIAQYPEGKQKSAILAILHLDTNKLLDTSREIW